MMYPSAVAKSQYPLQLPRSPQGHPVLAIKLAVIFPPVDGTFWRPLSLAIEASKMV